MQLLGEEDYVLGSQPRLPYSSDKTGRKLSIHSGQRKLLMTEVQFLTKHWDPELHPNPICLYIGASPGLHLDVMIPMFPEFEFILVDPQQTKVSVSHQDYSYEYRNQFFNDSEARKFACMYRGRNVFFICDIRSDPTNMSAVDIEIMIWNEMMAQARWVMTINPVACHLKCRFPWVDKIPKDYNDGQFFWSEEWNYLKGNIYIQPWAMSTTTEARLVAVRPYEIAPYNAARYEEQMFYVNTVMRETTTYLNPFTKDASPPDPTECIAGYPELINDFDSTLEAIILSEYIEKRNLISPGAYPGDLQQEVINLSRHCTMTMSSGVEDDNEAKKKTHSSVILFSLGLMRKLGLLSTAAIPKLSNDRSYMSKINSYINETKTSPCARQRTKLNSFPNWPSTEPTPSHSKSPSSSTRISTQSSRDMSQSSREAPEQSSAQSSRDMSQSSREAPEQRSAQSSTPLVARPVRRGVVKKR